MLHKIAFAIFLCLVFVIGGMAQKKGKVVTEKISSEILRENLVGLDVNRKVLVYLPPGYETSGKSYPVVYYFHSIFGNADMILGGDNVVRQLERAFANKIIGELIFVAADYSSSTTGSLYENSPVSGRWLDFTTEELVPLIDKKFRTIRNKDSRALSGDFMGGRGALKLAMTHADLFSVVYAMHPVATGMGYQPWAGIGIEWDKVFQAKSLKDVPRGSQIFVSVCQAFLPNPNRPPLYCDYFMEKVNDGFKPNVENMIKAKHGFHLEETVRESVDNLKKLRGIAFDWARYDGNYDHIHAARVLTRELDDLGIEHEAEEYRGTPWNNTWNDNGRFYARALPFIARYLKFE